MELIVILHLLLPVLIKADQFYETFSDTLPDPLMRNAIKWSQYKWPNGIIPYEFSEVYCKFTQSIEPHLNPVKIFS